MEKKQPSTVHITAYYPPHIGGMEAVAYEIAQELARREYDVRVLTSDVGAEGAPSHEREPFYEVTRLKSTEIAHTPVMWSLFFRIFFLPRGTILHVHIAQAGIPEIVLLAAKLRGFAFIGHYHLDVGPSGSFGALLPLYKKHVLSRTLRHATKVIVLSDEQGDFIQKEYKVSKNNIRIVPNGVGKSFFAHEPRTTHHTPLRLLYVGRLAVQKRVERVISALALLTVPIELTIVGDGEDREKLENLTEKLALTNVTFAGKKYGEELKDYYRNADVLVMPSDIEGMPLVALEAMAAALPIIGSDVPGISELLQDVGILVDTPSPETFAAAITDIIEHPEKLKILSRSSLEKAQNYSWEELVGTVEEIYKEVSI
ncbi:glycosyltransferase family 4 protein [Patescibacteria group bacterium]|nr:glycosyltransferase family 4 protein [Patescibacteria group bacterium]